MPEVSVVLAVHNGMPYLPEAVGSILGQSLTDLELIVVDDGSTDTSCQALSAFHDSRMQVLHNGDHRGLSASLNRGIRRASSDLIARIDADDIAEERRLERQVDHLRRHPNHGVVGSWYEKIGPAGESLGKRQLPSSPSEFRWSLLFICPLIHSAALIRRDCLTDVGFYDEGLSYAMDFDLWRRISERYDVINLPEYLTKYRVSDTSMTATYGDRTKEGDNLGLNGLQRRLGWGDVSIDDQRARQAVMRIVALGQGGDLGRGAFAATRDLLVLRTMFAREEAVRGIHVPESVAYRATLARALMSSLLAAARGRRGREAAGRLSALAALLLPP